MVHSKTELFSKETQLFAEMFKALSHPARIEILRFLAKQNSCFSGNISDELPLSRTTINQHLAELKKVGLIKGTVSGTKTNYCLCSNGIEKLKLASKSLLELVFDDIKTCDIN